MTELARPWWKKKRWAVAAVLLLLAAYPLAMGPLGYAAGRHWLPYTIYDPLSFGARSRAVEHNGSAGTLYHRYVRWWWRRGQRETLIRKIEAEMAVEPNPMRREAMGDAIDRLRNEDPEF